MTKKIDWISIVQGMAIFMVLVGHCWVVSDNWINDFCYGVHMPLFMFVSGGLFFMTRINRDWKWKDVVVDKLKRLGIPYISFIIFSYVIGKKSQKEIKQMLADYDLFAQPSRFEGFGLTVAEAMSAGVPVLVSEGQGPSEVTCGNQYGWTFRNGDSSDLKAKIAYIIDNYEEALDKAEKAINHVRNTYDVSITAKTYINEYQNFIERRK